jgi:AraC-like DNA-binding protein
MTPQLLKISLSLEESFSVRTDLANRFYNQWHYHPEVELIYIVEGTGTAIIGDSINNVQGGDLFLIGSNLPHMFRSDDQYNELNSDLITEAIVLHFHPSIIDSFLKLPENKAVDELLKKSLLGLCVLSDTREKSKLLLRAVKHARNSQRVIYLLQILQLIAESNDVKSLSHKPFISNFNSNDEHRLNRIYHYTLNNYLKEITLKEISNVIYMTPHAFCRYFKSRTKKTYSQFLLEMRVGQACKLLAETDYSIAVVSYESGFMNFSNFNRKFKQITGNTPIAYRKKFSGTLSLTQERLSKVAI